MSATRLLAAWVAAFGVWLALAASAGAVPPPNPITLATGPTCATDAGQPSSWFAFRAQDEYTLAPAQSLSAPGGLTVAAQTLSFGNPTFSITTAGCWTPLGDPRDIPAFPFTLLQWTTTQTVEFNGLYLVPVSMTNPPTMTVYDDGTLTAAGNPPGTDTQYDIYAHTGDSPTGPLVIVGRVDLGQTPYHVPQAQASGFVGSFGPSPQGPTFAGQSITRGDITISDTSPTGACLVSSHVAVQLPLPSVFSTLPSSGPPPTGEADYDVSVPGFDCGASSGGGGGGAGGSAGGFGAPTPTCNCVNHVHAAEAGDPGGQPIHLTVPDLYLGGLEIHNAFLDYDPSSDLWTGGGDLQLGDGSIHAAPPPPGEGFGFYGNGAFGYGGASYTFATPQPLLFSGPPPVTLSEIGVKFALNPTTFGGDATLSVAGGQVTIHGTVLVVFGDANQPFTYQGQLAGVPSLQIGSTPITSFAAGISGTVSLNELPGLPGGMQLGSGYVFYMSPGYFEFAGNVSQDLFGIVQANGNVTGALDLRSDQYNLAGKITVCANFPLAGSVCAGALQAVVSSTGIGACGQFAGFTVGFTYQWGGSLPSPFGSFLGSCDSGLGPVTVVVQPGHEADRARIARAAEPVGFNLPPGVPGTSVWVTGSGGPPQIAVTGPHGQRLSNGEPGRSARSGGLVIWPEPQLGQTLIAIRRPTPGRWTITPLPGSPAITRVAYANGLPPTKISAAVLRHGRLLTLHYRIRDRDGQTVTFAERSDGVFRVLGDAAGGQGSLTFTPADGVGRRREIVAMISRAGIPRQNMVIAHYTTSAPPRPATPTRVRVTRAGSDLMVSWLPADRWGCLVLATLSDGRRVLYRMGPMRHSLRISRLAPGIGARINVLDLDQTGDTSAAADASLAAARPAPVTGLTIRRLGHRLAINWRPAAGTSKYLVTINVGSRTPVTLLGLTVHPELTLIKTAHYLLASGAISHITVLPVGLTGQPGPAATIRYAAGGSIDTAPHPLSNRPLRAVEAIE